jgi:dienelactone hydrolase
VSRGWLALGLCACAGAGAAPKAVTGPQATAIALPKSVDRGELDLTLHGKPFGSETFAIERTAAGYLLRAEVRLEAGGRLRLLDSELFTDPAWRPLAGTFRDVKDGGTISKLAGAPLTLSGTAPFAPPSTRTASRDVGLFLADNTISHFAPLCAIAAPTTRVAFPGMDVTVGPDEPRAGGRLQRRRVDLGGTMRALLLCDRGRLIALELPLVGLAAVRRGRAGDVAAAAAAPRTKPPLPAGLIEEPRTVRVAAGRHGDHALLACALVRPAVDPAPRPPARRPAVVLITGSGAQDRDGDSVGPAGVKLSLLKVLAGALGAAGVVSLRCDDRGTAASTGSYGDATLDTFVGDAAAMVAALRREPTVDRGRLIVVGHSEGAVVAPRVAVRDRTIAGLVLLAGPGRAIDVVLLEQVALTLRRAGLTGDEIETALGHHRDAFAAIRAGAPLPETAEAREWSGGEAWLGSHLRHDARATAAALRDLDVLVAQGGLDQQVAVADADVLAAALRTAAGVRVTVALYPALNHNFAASDTGDVSEYVYPDLEIDAAFVADVVAFVVGIQPRLVRAASARPAGSSAAASR